MKLKDQVAVITGSGSGIGRAIALAFAREGAEVVVTDIQEESCLKVLAEVKKYSPNSMAMKADVSRGDEVRKLVDSSPWINIKKLISWSIMPEPVLFISWRIPRKKNGIAL